MIDVVYTSVCKYWFKTPHRELWGNTNSDSYMCMSFLLRRPWKQTSTLWPNTRRWQKPCTVKPDSQVSTELPLGVLHYYAMEIDTIIFTHRHILHSIVLDISYAYMRGWWCGTQQYLKVLYRSVWEIKYCRYFVFNNSGSAPPKFCGNFLEWLPQLQIWESVLPRKFLCYTLVAGMLDSVPMLTRVSPYRCLLHVRPESHDGSTHWAQTLLHTLLDGGVRYRGRSVHSGRHAGWDDIPLSESPAEENWSRKGVLIVLSIILLFFPPRSSMIIIMVYSIPNRLCLHATCY